MILGTDGRKARPAKAGQMIRKRLAEVHAAGLFPYGGENIGVDMDDLFDEPLAVDVAQLGECGERLPAVYHADRETIRIGLRRGREGKRKERVLVVLFENDDGAGEFAALAVGLVPDVFPESHPPNFAFAKIKPRGFVRGVGGFLDAIPAVEVLLHR
jgi:hypothetical protein